MLSMGWMFFQRCAVNLDLQPALAKTSIPTYYNHKYHFPVYFTLELGEVEDQIFRKRQQNEVNHREAIF